MIFLQVMYHLVVAMDNILPVEASSGRGTHCFLNAWTHGESHLRDDQK